MEQKTLNLNDLTIHELKALAFDEYVKVNISTNNLTIINNELSNRKNLGEADAEPVYSKPQTQ